VVDSFTVTVDNGSGVQLTGVWGVVQDSLHALAIRLGLSQPDTIQQKITLSVSGNGEFGDRENSRYASRQSYWNCTLMATAAAIGQVLGRTPTEADMVFIAKTTNSVVKPGAKMYLDESINDGVAVADAVVLMKKYYDLTATTTKYDDSPVAMADLQAALAYGNAGMTTVAIGLIWNAVPDAAGGSNPSYTDLDHEVVVIKVDLSAGKVYLNDSSATDNQNQPIGAGMEVPLGAFLSAWKTSTYELTVVDKPAAPPAQEDPGVA
jgi:hypothetical protein